MVLTAQDVHDKQFKLVRQTTGYDMDEVDAFLDEVEAELSRLHERITAAEAGQSPDAMHSAPGPAPESTVSAAARLLELAQRTADEHLAEAKRQADAVAAEAQQRSNDILAALEAQRGELEGKVSRLRSFEASIRSRLRGYLETQLRDLDASAEQTAGNPDDEG